MSCTLTCPALVLTLALASGVAIAQAQTQDGADKSNLPALREQIQPRSNNNRDNNHGSLSDSVRRAQREPGIRVLSAERVPFDGRDINRMKVIDERGRVRYMDDAGSNRYRTSSRDAVSEQAPPSARSDNPSQP